MSEIATSKNLTIAEVARQIGVSPATVSMAFSGKGTITPARREAVLEAARALGYEPNAVAQRLRSGRALNTIAIYSPSLDTAWTVYKMQHVQVLLSEHGFDVQFHSRPYDDQFHNEPHPGRRSSRPGAILRALRQEKPRAILCNAGWSFGAKNDGDIVELHNFLDEGGLGVCLSYGKPLRVACPQVVFDNPHSFGLAVQHLAELGHQEIGLVGHDVEREKSRTLFRESLNAHNLQLNESWIFATPELYFSQAGFQAAQQFLAAKHKPTAMIVNADETANAFINVLVRAGVKIPDDLSVISLDDLGMAPYCVVGLTAVSHPYLLHAERAVEALLGQLQEKNVEGTQFVRGTLTVRESTAPPKTKK